MKKVTYQGEDIILIGETALDLTDYDEIKVSVYHRSGEIVLQAAMVGATGWDNTLFRTVDTKEFEVLIPASVSSNMKTGPYYAEVVTEYTDTDWSRTVFDKNKTEQFIHTHARIETE